MKILPDYNKGMLKWLLWHEKYHMELKHHDRYFKYLKELAKAKTTDEFHVTKDEVNIIMDILVHDSLSKMFPELVETAVNNYAQMRNRNSLEYTFTTRTLEEMLDEYSKHKHGEDTETGDGDGTGEGTGESVTDESGDGEKTEDTKKSHGEGDKPKDEMSKGSAEKGEPEEIEGAERPDPGKGEHDKTDWSKLKDIDTKEFIDKDTGDRYVSEINKLKRKKLKMGRLTHTLNSLATTKRERTYRLPSMLQTGDGCIFKGKSAGKVELYLIFDASGSMSGEMDTFKEIISKSIPQAMNCPCEWFAGCHTRLPAYKTEEDDGYFKGTFKDFMPVWASSGYSDDGDRTIELCYQAEQMGYSPIGVTDGGGKISWSEDKLKKLKRTILVGQNGYWLSKCKRINPHIQTLEIDI
jgi:hypothetical protein